MRKRPERLLLVRHGESLGNVANAHAYAARAKRLDVPASDPDIELSDLGVRQAHALGTWLSQQPEDLPTRVLVSPYRRARHTADQLLASAGLAGLEHLVDERLRDREQGILDRLTWFGVADEYPEEAERRRHLGKFWYRPPGGESWADVALRVRAVLREVDADLGGERVLVVSHDVPILMVRYVLERLAPDEAVALSGQVKNCSVTSYAADSHGGELQLLRFNDGTAVAEHPSAQVTAHA